MIAVDWARLPFRTAFQLNPLILLLLLSINIHNHRTNCHVRRLNSPSSNEFCNAKRLVCFKPILTNIVDHVAWIMFKTKNIIVNYSNSWKKLYGLLYIIWNSIVCPMNVSAKFTSHSGIDLRHNLAFSSLNTRVFVCNKRYVGLRFSKRCTNITQMLYPFMLGLCAECPLGWIKCCKLFINRWNEKSERTI